MMRERRAGDPSYHEWSAHSALGRHVACLWAARFGANGEPHTDRVLPDGCIDLVWDGARLVVAGPDTHSVALGPRTREALYLGVRFRPGMAPSLLGLPASELLDARIDAVEALGPRVSILIGQLEETTSLHGASLSLREAAEKFGQAFLEWLPEIVAPDRLVEAAVAQLEDASSARRVGTVARALGVSERHLNRRCVAAIGYGPKMLQRVMRFRRFLALAARADPRDLAACALDAGYADQPHLTRECQELAGLSPRRLLESRPPF
jgi:AraC-like DNA-binding protein